jgi:hypothetical protein
MFNYQVKTENLNQQLNCISYLKDKGFNCYESEFANNTHFPYLLVDTEKKNTSGNFTYCENFGKLVSWEHLIKHILPSKAKTPKVKMAYFNVESAQYFIEIEVGADTGKRHYRNGEVGKTVLSYNFWADHKFAKKATRKEFREFKKQIKDISAKTKNTGPVETKAVESFKVGDKVIVNFNNFHETGTIRAIVEENRALVQFGRSFCVEDFNMSCSNMLFGFSLLTHI